MSTILFLGANPSETTRLALGEEVRAITRRLRSTPLGAQVHVVQEWAVRVSDLQECLLRHRPTVVHFSGHGNSAGQLLVEDEQGRAAPLDQQALTDLFRLLGEDIRAVVLNACFSAEQARAIAGHVDCVVGMSAAIGDRASIAFSASFYQALGHGETLEKAFHLGRNEVALQRLPASDAPRLMVRAGANPAELRLPDAPAKAVSAPLPPAKRALLVLWTILAFGAGVSAAQGTSLLSNEPMVSWAVVFFAFRVALIATTAVAAGQRLLGVGLAGWVGILMVAKPFIAPERISGGRVFSSTSETHLYYLVPGVCLLAPAAIAGALTTFATIKQQALRAPRWGALLIAAALAGGGALGRPEPPQERSAEEIAWHDGMRRKWRVIAERLPPEGKTTRPPIPGELSPRPIYPLPSYAGTGRARPIANTEIVGEEQLTDPLAKPRYDLVLCQELLSYLVQTEYNVTAETRGVAKRYVPSQPKGFRYLVVYRAPAPGALDAGADGGTFAEARPKALEVFVFDLETIELLSSMRVALPGWFEGDREALAHALTVATGGSFNFDTKGR